MVIKNDESRDYNKHWIAIWVDQLWVQRSDIANWESPETGWQGRLLTKTIGQEQSHSALETPVQKGQFVITDSFLCP